MSRFENHGDLERLIACNEVHGKAVMRRELLTRRCDAARLWKRDPSIAIQCAILVLLGAMLAAMAWAAAAAFGFVDKAGLGWILVIIPVGSGGIPLLYVFSIAGIRPVVMRLRGCGSHKLDRRTRVGIAYCDAVEAEILRIVAKMYCVDQGGISLNDGPVSLWLLTPFTGPLVVELWYELAENALCSNISIDLLEREIILKRPKNVYELSHIVCLLLKQNA